MIKSFLQNRQKALMVSVLAFAFMFSASAAYAALTFGALATTSDGAYTLTAVDDMLLTLTSGTNAEDFTISVTGATNSSLFLASSGTGADAMQLSTSAGGLVLTSAGTSAAALDLNATGTVAGNAITVDTTDGGIAITAAGAANGDLTLTVGDDYIANVTGIWDNNVTGAATLDAASLSLDATAASNLTVTGAGADLTLASVLGSVLVSSTEDAALSIRLHANGGTSETISIHSDLGTGAGSITLLSDAGGITLNASGAVAITNNATVGGTLVVTGAATFTAGAQSASVARTATADGTGTGAIAAGTSFVTVTSDDANKIVTLPAPTVGNVVYLMNAATGYELRSTDPATIGINGGTSAAGESAIGADVLVRCVASTATNWVCNNFAAAGTVSATQVAAD